MLWHRKDEAPATQTQEEWEAVNDVRKAERDLHAALWQFNEALGQDHVDYAIYSLEAAEKKLDMLLRKAKGLQPSAPRGEEGKVKIG